MIDYFSDLQITVAYALAEDVRSGDITAQIIDKSTKAAAHVIAREDALVCGRPWVDEVAKQVDDTLQLKWRINDGEQVRAGEQIFSIEGSARSILTAESDKDALNAFIEKVDKGLVKPNDEDFYNKAHTYVTYEELNESREDTSVERATRSGAQVGS